MHNQLFRPFLAVQLIAWAAAGCSGPREAAAGGGRVVRPTRHAFAAGRLPEAVRAVIDKPFTGDFDEMVKRRAIRVAVTFNRTHYFIDRGQERGHHVRVAEALREGPEHEPEDRQPQGPRRCIVPMSRDQLYSGLTSGKVDMVAAMVTVTPEREKLVAFSEPTRTNVSQIVVTGPGAPAITSVDDLAGKEVFVRKGSIYDESLARSTSNSRRAASRRS